ncbi:MAG TPA: penicillin acylase family protein [Chitinophagaceae bacterium]|nr:penicillin acylase family protein [Chitinophagaceae bacterium]
MKKLLLFFLVPAQLFAQNFSKTEISRWENEAKQVTIIRDNWGIPHVYGNTDADAVFGLMYAQCEDDFKRMEMNYIEKLGRMAEVKGESSLYDDLLIRMVIDSADAISDYNKAPIWLKKLCIAFADGMNYYLYKHPEFHPALLNRFQPWYPLLWTDGSIGAINTAGVSANELKSFYSGSDAPVSLNDSQNNDAYQEEKLTGSNGFAFAPSITESHHAILYINPHVTLYFRPEVHMVSNEGLNAYGAVTWGQFFVYQGFNEHCGWMHTSSAVDAADTYIEKLSKTDNGWTYEYDGKQLPVKEKEISLSYKNGTSVETKTFTALFTGHGPIMTKRNGEYLSVKADNRILNGLIQCWQRIKAKSFADFKKTLDLKGNISNNTVYADAEGNIAYWHGNRIPIRDPKYDWSKPVDGTTSATEWKGYHSMDEIIHLINPPNGWLQNCNSTPFSVAGPNSPKRENYPAYMAPDGENFRAINAVRILPGEKAYTIDKVITTGYNTYLAGFEKLIPALVNAFEKSVSNKDSLYPKLKDAITILKNWNLHSGENSVATTLAVEWGQKIFRSIMRSEGADQVEKTNYFAATASAQDLLPPLLATLNELKQKFGKWQMPWGEINRYQRLTGNIVETYDDNKPSIPVGFASSQWGMIPSYASHTYPGTKKRYGDNGNSFICAVEFGKRIKAKSLLAGGESGDPNSKHFNDQSLMYSKGQFKDVLFYKEDVLKHAERTYHPGE